ncbi:hypothetical protein KIN20_029228, partial [Parelaphostrongylus tenuis]
RHRHILKKYQRSRDDAEGIERRGKEDWITYQQDEDPVQNPWCNGDQVEMDGFLIAETTTYVYLGLSLNMENNMKEELDRRRETSMGRIRAFQRSHRPANGPKTPCLPFQFSSPPTALLCS